MLSENQGRWLTYAEAGELLGISADAARLRARRQGWSRRTPNQHGATARVFVPEEALVHPSSALFPGRPGVDRGTTNPVATTRDQVDKHAGREVEADLIRVIRETIEGLVTPLREQLDRERSRADRAERQLEEFRTALADAVAAERITAGVAAGLRAEIERLITESRRPWWRRWFS